MARIKRATPCTRTALDRTITRLPLALKPSNSSVSWCSSSANQAASLTTANSNTNSTSSLMSQSLSALPSSKETTVSSVVTTEKKQSQ
ncbi:unnamed protein product [Rotaria magnacalcarata]|uniref:Uncharacterized protein n=2 Tax=Rotaria magnacalcarata TaxID=392030 RepID=A0A819RUT8_9BILA|nr:unnamed protein product [Rotaria magnacalcarata]CAF2257856.1 unnamed protein product [Rotaria magnacalcarata]CAF3860402.1 unnamed protein product [Rotaria magnacalcarata]CAF3865249.1 unnamed protein product [Rotaria magnacalcarata]CAF4051014.1 unnamed protein product [Rotaria magnacalcarata]